MGPAATSQAVLAVISLRALRVGQTAIITAVRHAIPSIRQKYLARGIVPGAQVLLLHSGDPVVVALEDSRWAIDGEDAEHIEVAPVGDGGGRSWWQRLMRLSRSLRGP
ncbi:MAG: FeoA family protein [Chromatiales bacterium]